MHCSRVPQTPLSINFFIKNGSHGTIYTFKNYFATVFSVFSVQFQQNKFYLNRPSIAIKVCLGVRKKVRGYCTVAPIFLESDVFQFLVIWNFFHINTDVAYLNVK